MNSHDSMWNLFLSEVEKQNKIHNPEVEDFQEGGLPLSPTMKNITPKTMSRVASREAQKLNNKIAARKSPVTISFERKPPEIEPQVYIEDDYREISDTIEELIKTLTKSSKAYEKPTSPGEADKKALAIEAITNFKKMINNVNSNIFRYITELKTNESTFFAEGQEYKRKTLALLSRLIQSEAMLRIFTETLKDQRNEGPLMPLTPETKGEEATKLNTQITPSELLGSRREHSIVDLSREDITKKREKIRTRNALNRTIVNLYIDNTLRDLYENSTVSPLLSPFVTDPFSPEDSKSTREKYQKEMAESVKNLKPIFNEIVDIVKAKVSELQIEADRLNEEFRKKTSPSPLDLPKFDESLYFWKNIPVSGIEGSVETHKILVINTKSTKLISQLLTAITSRVGELTTSVDNKPYKDLVNDRANKFLRELEGKDESVFGTRNIADIIINKITLIELAYNEQKKKAEPRRSEAMLDALYGAIFNTSVKSTGNKEEMIRGYINEYAREKINKIDKVAVATNINDTFFEDLILKALYAKTRENIEVNPVVDNLITEITLSLRGKVKNRKQTFSMTLSGVGDSFRTEYGDDSARAEARLQESFISQEITGKSSQKGFDKTRHTLPLGVEDRIKADTLSTLTSMFPGVPSNIAVKIYNLLGHNISEEKNKKYDRLDEITKSILSGKESKLGEYVAKILREEDEKQILSENPELLGMSSELQGKRIKEIKETRQSTRTKLVKKRDELRLWFISMGLTSSEDDIYDFSEAVKGLKNTLEDKNKELKSKIETIRGYQKQIEEKPDLARTQYELYRKELDQLMEFYSYKSKGRGKILQDLQDSNPTLVNTVGKALDQLFDRLSKKEVSRDGFITELDNLKAKYPSGVESDYIELYMSERSMRSDLSRDTFIGAIEKLKSKYPLGVMSEYVNNYTTRLKGEDQTSLERLVSDSEKYTASIDLLTSQEKEYTTLNNSLTSGLADSSQLSKEEATQKKEERLQKIVTLIKEFANTEMKNLDPDLILKEVMESSIDNLILVGMSSDDPNYYTVDSVRGTPFLVLKAGKDSVLAIFDTVSNQYLDGGYETSSEYDPKEIRNNVLENPLDTVIIELLRFYNSQEGKDNLSALLTNSLSTKYPESINRWVFNYVVTSISDKIKEVKSNIDESNLKKSILTEGYLKAYLNGKGTKVFDKLLEANGLAWDNKFLPEVNRFVEYVNGKIFGDKKANILVLDPNTNLVIFNTTAKMVISQELVKQLDIATTIANQLMSRIQEVGKKMQDSSRKINEELEYLKKMPLGEIAARLKGMSQKRDKLNAIQNLFKGQWDRIVELTANKNKLTVENETLGKLKNKGIVPTSKYKLFKDSDSYEEIKRKSLFYLGKLKSLTEDLSISLAEEFPDENGDMVSLSDYIPPHMEGIEMQSLSRKLSGEIDELMEDIENEETEIKEDTKSESDKEKEEREEQEDSELPADLLSVLGGFEPTIIEEDGDYEDSQDDGYEKDKLGEAYTIKYKIIDIYNRYVSAKCLFEAGSSQDSIFTLSDSWDAFLERVTQVIEQKGEARGVTRGVKVEEEGSSNIELTEEQKMLQELGMGMPADLLEKTQTGKPQVQGPTVLKDTRPTAKGTKKRTPIRKTTVPGQRELGSVMSPADRREMQAEFGDVISGVLVPKQRK